MNQLPVKLPIDSKPILSVVIHTEEEFDWGKEFNRDNTSVSHFSNIDKIQSVFDKHSIKPVYVIGHPIVTQKSAFEPLKEIADSGRAEIGTHLHPWVSPPYTESVSTFNSYPGNLERDVEFEKIDALTTLIEEKFGKRPVSYLAGRYGNGPNSVSILSELGYKVDISASPAFDYSASGGPDHSKLGNHTVWLDEEKTILGIPNTGAHTGLLGEIGPAIQPLVDSKFGQKIHLGGILSRLLLVDRLRISPEGYTQSEMRRLTGYLLNKGVRHFVFSFHSPSIKPGFTPYVRSEEDLTKFLRDCDDYFTYFSNELGGESMTAIEYRNWVLNEVDD